jgi:imidazole glycerol-phosphate synthase subunit HisF
MWGYSLPFIISSSVLHSNYLHSFFIDVSATIEARKTKCDTVQSVRKVLSIPLTVGGGVTSVADAQALLEAGADKVAVNSAAVKDPSLLAAMAEAFGSQCTVIAIDAVQVYFLQRGIGGGR